MEKAGGGVGWEVGKLEVSVGIVVSKLLEKLPNTRCSGDCWINDSGD